MKTYTKTETREYPRLIIKHDRDAENPRSYQDCVGHFFTKERNYKSPDGNMHPLYAIMNEMEEQATSTSHHIELMMDVARQQFKASAPKDGNSHDEDLHVIEIHPIYRYEHGNVSYKRGTAQGFDYSNCGFYFVTTQSISGETHTAESLAKAIDAELEEYTRWCNGEVYEYLLKDENGEDVDGWRGGFASMEDIAEDIKSNGINDFDGENMEDYFTN